MPAEDSAYPPAMTRFQLSALTLLVPALALAAEPSRSPPKAGAQKPAIHLRFAWPEYLTFQVAQSLQVEDGEGHKQIDAHRTYRMTVENAGKDFLRLVASDEQTPPEMIMAFDSVSPIVIDRKGAFQRVESTGDDVIGRLSQLMPQGSPQQTQLAEQLNRTMQDAGRKNWELRVGRWCDVTLTPGKPERHAVKMPMGSTLEQMTNPVNVDGEEVVTVEANVACTPQDKAKRCVRLVADTRQLQPYKASVDKRSAAERSPKERFMMKAARSSVHVEWVLEPDTLLLHSLQTKKADAIERERYDGTPYTEETRQMESYLFTYGPPPAQPSKSNPTPL